jgi:hypothetical protein
VDTRPPADRSFHESIVVRSSFTKLLADAFHNSHRDYAMRRILLVVGNRGPVLKGCESPLCSKPCDFEPLRTAESWQSTQRPSVWVQGLFPAQYDRRPSGQKQREFKVVPGTGLEPVRLAALDPKSIQPAFECKCKSKHMVDTLNPQPA